MHLNYHFFRFLCLALDTLLSGMEVMACFSQNKDELVIGFSGGMKEQYLRANLVPANTCLGFPETFRRSKKNSVSLFPEIVHDVVKSVGVLELERAFLITFSSGKTLLFKMHGSRSNVLLYLRKEELPHLLFRNELKEDWKIKIEELKKELKTDWERFKACEGNALQFLPTLGKIPREWLKSNGYLEADLQGKWALMRTLMDMLDSPLFSIIKEGNNYLFTMLPVENPLYSSTDPIDAANEFFRYSVVFQSFEKEKQALLKSLEDQKKRTLAYLDKTKEKLFQLKTEKSPSQIADILMANLHQIPTGATSVELFDFYQNKEITISIKKGLSPQKQAEDLYRKGKNRKIEIQQLEQNLEEKEKLLQSLTVQIEETGMVTNHRELKDFSKEHAISKKHKEQEQVPFKRFEEDGFEILVGKSAKSNDEMLRHYSWKEDLWLHAKDVAGSHVIIKYRSGTSFPKTIIERAAELAAYYSKNKNNSFAPVIYTPCKFVRKVKGSSPGAVVVDKENIIMVSPKGPPREG